MKAIKKSVKKLDISGKREKTIGKQGPMTSNQLEVKENFFEAFNANSIEMPDFVSISS